MQFSCPIESVRPIGARSEVSLDRVRLIVNGYRQAKQLRLNEVESALGMKVLECVPNDPARVNQAVNKGIPVVLRSPRARFSKSIMDLAAAVNGHHGEPWAGREIE
jgi:MinD-like ATPase involved in chromosome partitioning or flagellar assembly